MFEITSFTEARLATLTNRIERHGDEEVPAVSLGIEITAANTLLDSIDPKIRHALYVAVEGQDQLPGVEPATPVLRCNSFERHTLPVKYDGWRLAVDDGVDDTQPMTFGGCKVDKLSVEAKQGGTVILRMRIGTSDLDAERSGMLGMHVGQSIWVALKAPEKNPDVIDASSSAKDLPPSAEDLFAAGTHGDAPEERDEDDDGPICGTSDAEVAEQPSVVREEIERIEGERSSINSTRTARGREKTAAALKAGARN